LKNSRYFDYRYFAEIQSHEPEFDHLKSVELCERINAMDFLHVNKNGSVQLLSTNDRIIKLWRLKNKQRKEIQRAKVEKGNLVLPKNKLISQGYEGDERRRFQHCHNYNVNCLSTSPDGENFISADDLCINMWNLDNNITAFNMVNLKPSSLEELQEIITHVEFHPRRSDVFLFSSSKGYMSLCDLRENSQFSRCSL
jgi:serine/threonine-protein phosphatase 2A regulatory subunit B